MVKSLFKFLRNSLVNPFNLRNGLEFLFYQICTKQFFKNSIFGLNSVLGRISKAKPETETEIRPKTEYIGFSVNVMEDIFKL